MRYSSLQILLNYAKGKGLEENDKQTCSSRWILYQHHLKESGASFISKGLQLPKIPSVMTLIHNYYSKIEQLYIDKFGVMKRENKNINICIDKWTSFRNRRYMNISCILQWDFIESCFNKNSWELSCRKNVIFTSGQIETSELKLEAEVVATAFLKKPPIVQLLKFPEFYGTRWFITVFTRALHWSLSWARSIHPPRLVFTVRSC
jgi:hypothetical protein